MIARVNRPRVGVLALVLAGGVVVSACSSPTSSKPAGSTSTAPRYLLNATLADNGGLLSVRPGDRLRIVLPSRAWVFQPSQHPQVVRKMAGGGVTPATACNAGKGCGTKTAYFKMGNPGNVVLKATCTQQALCAGEPTSFTLRVNVGSA